MLLPLTPSSVLGMQCLLVEQPVYLVACHLYNSACVCL